MLFILVLWSSSHGIGRGPHTQRALRETGCCSRSHFLQDTPDQEKEKVAASPSSSCPCSLHLLLLLVLLLLLHLLLLFILLLHLLLLTPNELCLYQALFLSWILKDSLRLAEFMHPLYDDQG